MYDIGDIYPVTVTIRNAAGTPTNATSVALTITLPDGTTLTPVVANPPAQVGVYTYDYRTAQAGHHTYRLVSTGPDTAHTDSFHVDAPASSIVSLADAKDHLGEKTTDNDEELRLFLDAATEAVEGMVGPVARKTFVDVTQASRGMLILNHSPVIELTSVVGAWGYTGTYSVSGMYLDGGAGIVRGFTASHPVEVTYVAGRPNIPAAIRLATLIIVAHLWETQRGAGTPAGLLAGGNDVAIGGFGFAIPNRARDLLAPYLKAPAVA